MICLTIYKLFRSVCNSSDISQISLGEINEYKRKTSNIFGGQTGKCHLYGFGCMAVRYLKLYRFASINKVGIRFSSLRGNVDLSLGVSGGVLMYRKVAFQ